MERAALVGRGVDDLLLLAQLGQLVALRVAPDAAGLVGEVDLEPVPAELPHDGDRDDARPVRPRAHGHRGCAERPRDAADRARVVGRVEDLQRPLHLQIGVRRHGADVARPARRLRRGPGRRLGLVVYDVGLVRNLARAPATRPQAVQEGPPATVVTRMAQLEVVAAGLADPALVLGAGRAQVADLATGAAGQERLGVLAAEQRAAADVAGQVFLVGADVAGASQGPGQVS